MGSSVRVVPVGCFAQAHYYFTQMRIDKEPIGSVS